MSLYNPHFSLQHGPEIDGYGLRVTHISAEVIANMLLALHLYHGDLVMAGASAIVTSGAEELSHVRSKSSP